MLQPTHPSLLELLNHFVKSFKAESKDPCSNTNIEVDANAKLSPFEKTYVSFPEFIDISHHHQATEERPLYSNNSSWHQQTLSF